jgi:hypothetical protein
MENNERDRKLDQWLDEALSQYSAAEPRLGLEQRVLANVRAEEQARAGRRTWWRWMPAFATIAAVLVVMVAVKPYWEEKTSRNIAVKERAVVPEKRQAQERKSDAIAAALQAPSQGQPESRSSVSTQKLSAANESEHSPAKQKARVQNAEDSRATRIVEDATVTKDLERALPGNQEETSKQMETRQETTVIPSGAGTGVSGGIMPSAKVAAMPRPVASPVRANVPQMQTIQVQSAAASIPVGRGAMGADRLPTPAEGSVQVRTVQMKPAANASVTANTMEVMGVTLRTDAIASQARQVQQFPTPTPLSKQEKLMLAASKQLQEKPAASDKKKDEISPIEIKKIEIEPLPGREK